MYCRLSLSSTCSCSYSIYIYGKFCTIHLLILDILGAWTPSPWLSPPLAMIVEMSKNSPVCVEICFRNDSNIFNLKTASKMYGTPDLLCADDCVQVVNWLMHNKLTGAYAYAAKCFCLTGSLISDVKSWSWS